MNVAPSFLFILRQILQHSLQTKPFAWTLLGTALAWHSHWEWPLKPFLGLIQASGQVIGMGMLGLQVDVIEVWSSGLSHASGDYLQGAWQSLPIYTATMMIAALLASGLWLLWFPRLRVLGLLFWGIYPWLFWPLYTGQPHFLVANIASEVAWGSSLTCVILIVLQKRPTYLQAILNVMVALLHILAFQRLLALAWSPDLPVWMSRYGAGYGMWIWRVGSMGILFWGLLVAIGWYFKRYEASLNLPEALITSVPSAPRPTRVPVRRSDPKPLQTPDPSPEQVLLGQASEPTGDFHHLG